MGNIRLRLWAGDTRHLSCLPLLAGIKRRPRQNWSTQPISSKLVPRLSPVQEIPGPGGQYYLCPTWMGRLGCPWCILYTTLKPPPLWAVLTPPLAHIAGPTDKQPSKLARHRVATTVMERIGVWYWIVIRVIQTRRRLAGGDTLAGSHSCLAIFTQRWLCLKRLRTPKPTL